MDKNAIKKFAVWARTELIARVSLKGVEYGITEDNIEDANADSVGGKVLTANEKKQRQALIAEINDKGYKQVMEEVAYTWFNRFSALRFMEVNGYLPSHVRVFTDEENNFKPQIIAEAIHLELDGLNMEKVYELKDAEKTEELYKYLLIVQCNALNKILPGMFQKIADYTELLLPDNLLREGSVIQQMIELIPEDDWKDAVQIIGWLYQYYIAEPKDKLINERKQYKDEDLPFVTQLFTSDWIVRYMVENSLGRLWIEGHPDIKEQFLPTEEEQSAYIAGNRDSEDTKWHYYMEETKQDKSVQAQKAEIRKEYATLTPEQLKAIDPCSGSGHILAYMFDVLMKIYESYGYTSREAVASIVENNLYGLDIDNRAVQMAYFAIMMKARQYDRRFFSRGIQPHVYAIVESNHIDKFTVDYFCNGDMKLIAAMDTIISELRDAKEYGSILTITPQDWSALYDRFAEIMEDINMSRETALRELLPLIQVAETMSQKYYVVVTNPPYMSATYMPANLKKFVQTQYADFKNDLFSVFTRRIFEYVEVNGQIGLLMPYVWMFIASYEKMREYINSNANITSLVQLEYNAFEAACVPVAALTLCKTRIRTYGEYIKLSDFKGIDSQALKTLEAILDAKCGYRFTSIQSDFCKIPGAPMAYWVSESFIKTFENETLYKYSISPSQNVTGNNRKYVRKFWELIKDNIGGPDNWIFYCKGGGYRKWWGNLEDVVNWTPEARNIYQYGDGKHASQIINKDYWYREGITWGLISSALPSFRVMPQGATYDKGGSTIIVDKNVFYFSLALLNSKVYLSIAIMLNPTLNFQVKDVRTTPLVLKCINEVNQVTKNNIMLSKSDWDSFETSWDFQHHPLICKVSTIAEAFDQWQAECDERFNQLKANEEELNRIFIDIYGLQEELTPEVEDKDVTVRRADLGRDIRSFISYAVGCMFGRYSIYKDGLIFAGEPYSLRAFVDKMNERPNTIPEAEINRAYYHEGVSISEMFAPDVDNIIPICDDEYFEDDIAGLFVKFVKTVYGADTLDKNLKFIADALGGKGQPKDVIRNYFLNDFYKDHCKIYQKRPIYWLFDSGKKNGFKALIYMHRYQPDTIARIRTDYVHEQQARYRTAIADLEQRIANASTGERVKLNKKLTTLQAQDTEIRTYEEKIHHLADQMISIDLDDGVKKNYAIFQDVLAKIK